MSTKKPSRPRKGKKRSLSEMASTSEAPSSTEGGAVPHVGKKHKIPGATSNGKSNYMEFAQRRAQKRQTSNRTRRAMHAKDVTGFDLLGDMEQTECLITPSKSKNLETFMRVIRSADKAEMKSGEIPWALKFWTGLGCLTSARVTGMGNPLPNEDSYTGRGWYFDIAIGMTKKKYDESGKEVIGMEFESGPFFSNYWKEKWRAGDLFRRDAPEERTLTFANDFFYNKLHAAVVQCLAEMYNHPDVRHDVKTDIDERVKSIEDDEEREMAAFKQFREGAKTPVDVTHPNEAGVRAALVNARIYDLKKTDMGRDIDAETDEEYEKEAEKQIDKEIEEGVHSELFADECKNIVVVRLTQKVWYPPQSISGIKDANKKRTAKKLAESKINIFAAGEEEKIRAEFENDPENTMGEESLKREIQLELEKRVCAYMMENGWQYNAPEFYTSDARKKIVDERGDVFDDIKGLGPGALMRLKFRLAPYSQSGGPKYGVRSEFMVDDIKIIAGSLVTRKARGRGPENIGRFGEAEGTNAMPTSTSVHSTFKVPNANEDEPERSSKMDDDDESELDETSSSTSASSAKMQDVKVEGANDYENDFLDPDSGLISD